MFLSTNFANRIKYLLLFKEFPLCIFAINDKMSISQERDIIKKHLMECISGRKLVII